MFKLVSASILAICFATAAQAKIVHKKVEYKEGSTQLEGILVYDDAKTEKRPGVMIAPNWMGLTDETDHKAEMIVALGYVAFEADPYGKGIHPKDQAEAGKLATALKTDRKTLRARMNAGLKVLQENSLVNISKLAAIGYCLGGTSVIELARSGAPLAAVVSFHGGLDSPTPADGKNIKAKVLALHGADDPFEKPEDLVAFEKEMRDSKVDWQLIKYGGAVHSFTDKSAGSDNSKGAAYNERADRRAVSDMKTLFAETF